MLIYTLPYTVIAHLQIPLGLKTLCYTISVNKSQEYRYDHTLLIYW